MKDEPALLRAAPSAPAHSNLLGVRFVDRDANLLVDSLARRLAGREIIRLLPDLIIVHRFLGRGGRNEFLRDAVLN